VSSSDTDGLHERGDVVGELLGRIDTVGLVLFSGAAEIDADAGEAPRVFLQLKRVAGMVGPEVGEEDQGLAASLLLIVDRDVVRSDLWHDAPAFPAADARAP
jgi:hypothetical protein